MGLATIPDDWEDEYIDYVVRWPLSPKWEAILRGQLSDPHFETFWDLFTGDPTGAMAAMPETFDTNLDLQEGAMLPAGLIIDFAGSTIPDGWLVCDGSEVSRTTYARLFAAIGETYGAGNGTTTFELPQSVGRVNVSRNPADSDFNNLGDFGGQKEVTLEVAEMPTHTHTQDSHNHSQNAHNHTDDRGITTGVAWSGGVVTRFAMGDMANDFAALTNNLTSASNIPTTATNQDEGGGTAHNNLPPYIVFNRLIKT